MTVSDLWGLKQGQSEKLTKTVCLDQGVWVLCMGFVGFRVPYSHSIAHTLLSWDAHVSTVSKIVTGCACVIVCGDLTGMSPTLLYTCVLRYCVPF